MNSIRRAITITVQRKRLLSIIHHQQQQHASYSTTTRTTSPSLKSSKPRSSETPPPPPDTETKSSPNDAAVKDPVIWPKPSDIPWQSKVVNAVNLIGRVKVPVQFEASSDGKSWAGTIISQDDDTEFSTSLTSFWIPVIFEGDLAHIAMCHLKEKDFVHVAGHLSVDVPPFKLSDVQANVQVMAHSIDFVQKFQSKKPSTPRELDRRSNKNSVVAILENNAFSQQSLKEPDSMSMLEGALSKERTRAVAFEEENYANLLDNARSSLVHNLKETGHLHSHHKVDKPSIHVSWRDLLANPKQWLDKREDKRTGLVKANYPDFTHKDTRVGLWLNQAPVVVLQGLGRLEFFNSPNKDEKVRLLNKDETISLPNKDETISLPNKFKKVKDGDSWKHLIENPSKWWDNRLDKKNPKGPDFKNKDSGKVLWLTDAPSWASSSLPPVKAKTVDVNTKNKWASH